MTSVERYRQEWSQLLRHLDDNPENATKLAYSGNLKVSKFRSVYWALLLRVLNEDYRSWRTQREQQRTRYKKFEFDFVRNPHDRNVPDDDPLSQSNQSVWNQYFSDQELFNIINLDVVRTFPGIDFFRKPIIQKAMSNILFYYAREHPYMCYRQGMHEILAPIIFVLYGDHQSLLHFKEITNCEINNILLDVINPNFLEADSYSVFSRLMSSVESYYRVSSPVAQTIINPDGTKDHAEVEVISHLNYIRDKILVREDLHLHNYLLKLGIPLHIFGIRWLRLLFGREFPLLDLLVLWDAIFADSDRFALPNYLLVAMLIHIRKQLFESEYTKCLTYLMRYPANIDVSLVLRHALHMLNPKKFERPIDAFNFISFVDNFPPSHTGAIILPTSSVRTPLRKSFPYNSSEIQQQHHSTALNNRYLIDKQVNIMQKQNAAQAAVLERLKVSPETNRVMDGYLENSPELLRLELKNAQTIIGIAQTKLQAYLATIRKHLVKNSNDDLCKSLDGIEELCSFLDVKLIFPFHTRSAPIDQALEANELQRAGQQKLSENKINKNNTLFLHTANANANISYEKPDADVMLNSARILGNLREIELIPIATDEKVDKSWVQEQNELPAANPLGNNRGK